VLFAGAGAALAAAAAAVAFAAARAAVRSRCGSVAVIGDALVDVVGRPLLTALISNS
jgi:hypothetical protein